jgi:integrase
MLFLDGGLRLSELAGLRVANVNLRESCAEAGIANSHPHPSVMRGRMRSGQAGGNKDNLMLLGRLAQPSDA